MRHSFENQDMDGPKPDVRSSLSGKGGHGSKQEKRGSVGEVFEKLKVIIALLPYDSKQKLGRQADLIRKDPEQAIEIIRNEVEAQRAILDLLDNPVSTDEVLDMLDEVLPKEKIQ